MVSEAEAEDGRSSPSAYVSHRNACPLIHDTNTQITVPLAPALRFSQTIKILKGTHFSKNIYMYTHTTWNCRIVFPVLPYPNKNFERDSFLQKYLHVHTHDGKLPNSFPTFTLSKANICARNCGYGFNQFIIYVNTLINKGIIKSKI